MNSSKANNGWTLNPSKSFPGKFYYFNVHNGESVWTTDPEKTISKDSNIHKISDRSYFPREPSTPPPDFPSTSTVAHLMNQSTFIRQPETQRVIKNTINKYPTPSFGKAAFPNYMSDVELYVPNVVWAPVPLPTVPSMCKIDSRRYLNMSSQTDIIDKVRVDASSTSLSDRFAVYNSPFNRQVQIKYETSTPVKLKNDKSTSQLFFNTFQGVNESSIPNTSLQLSFKTVRTKSEADKDTGLFGSRKLYGLNFNELIPVDRSYEDCRTKSVLKEPFKRCCTVTAETNETLEDFESHCIGSIDDSNDLQRREPNKFDQENDEMVKFDDDTKEKDVFKLGDNDLRLLLIAKRKKSVGLGDIQGYASKKIKTYREEEAKQSTSQKRVSFNVQLEDSETGNDHHEVQVQTNKDPVEQLELPKDLWYIMVDPETLVDEYQLIEEYVLSDKSCRLLLPRSLRAAIEAMGMGDCRGRQRVIVARQSARRLAQPHAYIVTLPEIDISGNTSEMSDVLKYCLKINNLGYLVVFLTNSAKLLTDAKSIKITCLNTKEIKLNLRKPPEITFDLKKVKISVPNENSYSLPSSELNPYVKSNRDPNPEIVSDKNIFEHSSNNIYDKIKKVDANTSPVGSDKLIDINKEKNTYINNNNNVITYEEEANDIGKDIQNLFLNEVELTLGSKANNEKEKNSFEFKKPKTFEMKKVVVEKEYGSKKFDVKSDLIEERIRTRLDEWICCLSQIVEDALTQVLMRYTRFSDNTIRPWVLYDVVDHVKKLYDSHTEVRSMADKFTTMLLEQCSQIGYLKSTMPPTVFMDLFECAYLIIHALKQIQPTYYELSDAEEQMDNLLSEIEKPTNIILPISPPVITPDIVIESKKQNFIRHPSDIIDYVKKHFENWKNYEPPQDEENISKQQNENNIFCGDFKIVRTCGRNINLLNLDGKSLTVTNPTETVQKDTMHTGNTKEDNVTSTNNLLEDLNLSNSETWVDEASNNGNILTREETANVMNIESKSTKQEINLNQSMATPLETESNNEENMENTPQIQESETKLIKKPEIIDRIDLDALDYSEMKDSDNFKSKTPSSPISNNDSKNDSDISMTDAVSFVYEIRNTKKTNKISYFNENKNDVSTNRSYFQENNNITHESNLKVTSAVSNDSFDIISVKNDSINDSGIENDSVHAHSLVRVFLIELSQSFKKIHIFINKCVKDFRADRVREEQKLRMHAKANYLFITVADIITELKKIIQRESNDSTAVQAMLLRAGLQATEDKRITRYKQVVTKCLEQAITLENALKLILSMTGDDCDGSISTCTMDTNIRYFNIFG